MKTLTRQLISSSAFLISTTASSAQFIDNFSAETLSNAWQLRADAGYQFQQTGGKASFSGATLNEFGIGDIKLSTNFIISGDFSISVDIDASTERPMTSSLGIIWEDVSSLQYSSITLLTPFIIADIKNKDSKISFDPSKLLSFKLTRQGSTVALFSGSGENGFRELFKDTNDIYYGPVTAYIRAYIAGTPGTVYFDNFQVQADAISSIPEPEVSTLLLSGIFLLRVAKRRETAA